MNNITQKIPLIYIFISIIIILFFLYFFLSKTNFYIIFISFILIAYVCRLLLHIDPFFIKEIQSTIRPILLLFLVVYFFFSIINKVIEFLFGPPNGFISRNIAKLLQVVFFTPFNHFMSWCFSSLVFSHCFLYLDIFLLNLTKQKLSLYFFYFIVFLCPRLIFVYSIFLDVFILEQINLILKNILIFAYPLICTFFLYLCYYSALKEKSFLEEHFIIPSFCNNGSAIKLTSKHEHTSQYHFSSWDNYTFVIDRCLALFSFSKTLFVRCFNFIILILIFICYLQYLLLLL